MKSCEECGGALVGVPCGLEEGDLFEYYECEECPTIYTRARWEELSEDLIGGEELHPIQDWVRNAEIDHLIDERRQDPDFQARLERRMIEDRELLNRLARW